MRGIRARGTTSRLEGNAARVPLRQVPRLLRHPLETVDDVLRGRDLVRLQVGPAKLYLVNRPDLIEQVLAGDRTVFSRQKFDEATELRLGGDCLLRLEGDAHAERRSLVEPVFERAADGRYADAIAAVVDNWSTRWSDGSVVDLETAMTDVTVETIGTIVFGADQPELDDRIRTLYRLSRRVFLRGVMPTAPLLWRLPLPLSLKFDRAREAFDRAVDTVIARRRSNPADAGDVLSQLIETTNPDGHSLTDEQVRDEVWTYVAQGAPAYALLWTWWALGRHVDVEARLQAEIDGVLGGRLPTAADLTQLRTVRAAVLESLRLFPTSMGTIARTARPVELNGEPVPAGVSVMVSYWTTNRDERFWPNPEQFDLDRWLDDADGILNRDAYLPFGIGHRRCPARSLALTIGVLTIATLARQWRPRPLRDSVDLKIIPFVRPRGGMPARIEQRAVHARDTSSRAP